MLSSSVFRAPYNIVWRSKFNEFNYRTFIFHFLRVFETFLPFRANYFCIVRLKHLQNS